MKRGPGAEARLDPDAAAVNIHDPAAGGEPDPAALELVLRVQALEISKNLVVEFRLDADSIIPDREYTLACVFPSGHLDPRSVPGRLKLHRVRK